MAFECFFVMGDDEKYFDPEALRVIKFFCEPIWETAPLGKGSYGRGTFAGFPGPVPGIKRNV